MLYRIVTGLHADKADMHGATTAKRLYDALGIHTETIRVFKVFTIDGLPREACEELVANAVLHDPILQRAELGELACGDSPDWVIEVAFRPGVTDNEGRTAREAASMALHRERSEITVYTSRQYRIRGKADAPLHREDIERVARDMLANTLIERYRIKGAAEWEKEPGFPPIASRVTGEADTTVTTVPLRTMDDATKQKVSRENTWALRVEELDRIENELAGSDEAARRKKLGLGTDPTDVEMEILAQTWSEHCKHKIFASDINYTDERGRTTAFSNLYKSCIRDTTAGIRRQKGKGDYCKSVFSDNAGVIAFINGYDVCIKVETHNSPSALDPYGGALTGIVGVNRDPMGTGMGAELVCNLDVFCFASPFYAKKLPPRLLHPRRVLEGVREGVEHGGNKSGVPTVNGSLVFDERYLGKPLVYCGTVGLIPTEVNGKPGWQKKARVGDTIVMVGGRIGKDGIHGATFSSEELHEGSPATAVQIGDPITQRKLYDFVIRARDMGLYTAITDNGAGGLSSSVGEMAQDTGGCDLDIAKAPLKYDGLRPWEILLSEAQERMTLSVPKEHLATFLSLAKRMDVEATALGTFTDSGFFTVRHNDRVIASLNLDFMHNGVPKLELSAAWTPKEGEDGRIEVAGTDEGEFLKTMLGRLNICSKEYIVRQYDHEVRGGSVIKPLVGLVSDGPSDAGVLRPVVESDAGIVVSHGICPKFSDHDTYWMMANAMDEAIRNAVAVGGNPDAMAGVDNFCWCDPVAAPNNPDGEYKLAQLVRACQALKHFSYAFGLPCISGKDSMKNDYTNGNERISIPPTVLFTVLGVIPSVLCTQSSDFKKPGDVIYLLGGTWREMAGSEAAAELGITSNRLPLVDAGSALARYRTVHSLFRNRVVQACHDCSDGGLAVAIAEMCIGGRVGCTIDLDAVPALEPMTRTELLYSESASRLIVSVRPEAARVLDIVGMQQLCRRIGTVTDDSMLTVRSGDSLLFKKPVDEFVNAYKKTLAF